MTMASIQFYRNQYDYPHYSNSLTPYGASMPCTPVGMNLRTGTLRVKGDISTFMSCNYMSFTRGEHTLYAWIDDVQFSTADSFNVTYTVDPWRTYRSKINLGVQYIARSPYPTYKRDNLLGSFTQQDAVNTINLTIGQPNKRVFVVQVRPTGAVPFSRTPVQPTPYQFYMIEYDLNNWQDNPSLDLLMTLLAESAETQNIVTMYSIPWVDISSLLDQDLVVRTSEGDIPIAGFKLLDHASDPSQILYNETLITFAGINRSELMRVDHSVQIVIPEAGILNVPDEILMGTNIRLRQDIDLYSGASNYMLKTMVDEYYTQSVRGSSVASIPILSDPLDTYLSQNQNALATSLIGDVATIAGGAAVTASTGGLGALAGAGAVTSGIRGIAGRYASAKDAASRYSNPPAFLGTAMASNFNGRFWVVVTYMEADNAATVNENYGYPEETIGQLTFPSSGFIQTEGCSVYSTDGSVPRWAINEINQMFDAGIHVH